MKKVIKSTRAISRAAQAAQTAGEARRIRVLKSADIPPRVIFPRDKFREVAPLELKNIRFSSASVTRVSSNGLEIPEVISTFNHDSWTRSVSDDISVPGQVPLYDASRFKLPTKLKKQASMVINPWLPPLKYVDPNPPWIFGHAFAAARLMNPTFRFNGIDLLVGRGTLDRLFELCKRVTFGCLRTPSPVFRISLIRNTLTIQIRRPQTETDWASKDIQPTLDWGKSFEDAVTQLPGHLSQLQCPYHSRLIRYKFGNLNFAVQMNLDALYSTQDRDGVKKTSWAEIKTLGGETMTVDKLGLKTMSNLWFGRISHLIIGMHRGGVFSNILVTDRTRPILDWEESNQPVLKTMVALLSELRERARAVESRTVSVQYDPRANTKGVYGLQVFAHIDGAPGLPVPNHIIDQFWTP